MTNQSVITSRLKYGRPQFEWVFVEDILKFRGSTLDPSSVDHV